MKRPETVIISGGGTGGHLYPALAVGEKLRQRIPSLRIIFVGGSRKLEKSLMERYKAHFIPIKIEGLKGMGWKTFKSLILLPFSFLKSFSLLLRFRPDLVIGVGGYSSGPVVLLASWLKIPTLITEQNLRPGFTNRLLLPWVRKAVAAFESSLPYLKGKGVFIGNPTRKEFLNITPKKRSCTLTLLIFGGSQGSRFLNKGITDSLPFFKEEKNALQFIHQTGKTDMTWVTDSYRSNGFESFTVAAFFHDMARQFQKSDLVICRAGATTIAELIAAQKASLLVPFAKATDNHQMANARELERIRGAEVISEKEFQPLVFANKIKYFLHHKDKLDVMEENLKKLKTENVAGRISDLCLELMEKK